MAWMWGAGVFVVLALLVVSEPWLRSTRLETVQIDDGGVLREEGAIREQVTWDEVDEIRITTTSGDPIQEDVFFVLMKSGKHGCVVPHEAVVRTGLLKELQSRFAGIDNELVIKAMGCTSAASFTIWRREDKKPDSAAA